MRRHQGLRRSQGFSLIEVAMALGVASAALVGFIQMQSDAAETVKAISVATKLDQVYLASQDYLKDNYSTLLAQIPVNGVINVGVGKASATSAYPGTPIGLTNLPSLQGGGYLPSTYIDRNAYNQFSALLIKHVPAIGSAPEHLEAMITTIAGQTVRDRNLQTIASKVQAPGGMMLAKPLPNLGAPGQNVQGVYGGWSSPASDWQSASAGVGPQVGHSMMTFAFNQNGAMSDFLSRYAVPGTTEPNRMHTNIDANGNNLNNILNTDTESISNSRFGMVNVNSFLNVMNGGVACAGDSYGCEWHVSNDGGFIDYNDGWITFRGDYSDRGLKLTGPGNNLQVGGQTESIGTVTADNGVHIRGDWLRVDNNNGIVFRDNLGDPGGFYMQDNTWIRTYNSASIYAGNGAIRTDNRMQAPLYEDSRDASFYLAPSQTSQLNAANFKGNIGSYGYDAYQGLPRGWGGGLHTWDVYAEGTVAAGKNGEVHAAMGADGNYRSIGRMGTQGFDPLNGYPVGVEGGLHTWDTYAEGTAFTGNAGSVETAIGGLDGTGTPQGVVSTSQFVRTQVFRPNYVARAGDACSGVTIPIMNITNSRANSFSVQNGDIARDDKGNMLSCVSGVWTTPGGSVSQMVASGSGSSGSWFNNTGRSVFIEIATDPGVRQKETGLLARSNGAVVCYSGLYTSDSHTSGAIGSCSFWVLPNTQMDYQSTGPFGGGGTQNFYWYGYN